MHLLHPCYHSVIQFYLYLYFNSMADIYLKKEDNGAYCDGTCKKVISTFLGWPKHRSLRFYVYNRSRDSLFLLWSPQRRFKRVRFCLCLSPISQGLLFSQLYSLLKPAGQKPYQSREGFCFSLFRILLMVHLVPYSQLFYFGVLFLKYIYILAKVNFSLLS